MIRAPKRYKDTPGNADLVYDALCKILADRASQVDWSGFTSVDWDLLPTMALFERVGPLVVWKFDNDNWPPGIPLVVAADLVGQYYRTLKANTRRFEELNRILAALDKNSIPVILVKGAHLAYTIYPDIALRPMTDFDLLVRRHDLDQALSLVNHMGFSEYIPELIPGLNQEIGHHYHLKDEQGICLELHWSLVAGGDDWRKPPDDWAWSQSDEISDWHESGLQPLSLNFPANLTYLIAHLSLQHGIASASLGWFYDLHLLIQDAGSQTDWDGLSDMAQQLGWSYAFGVTLREVQERLNTSIPTEYLIQRQSEQSKDASLVINKSIQSVPLDRALNALAPYKTSMKIKVIVAHLFPSPDLIRYVYSPQPEWLWPLYYPYRLWEIACKILSGLYHRFTNLSLL